MIFVFQYIPGLEAQGKFQPEPIPPMLHHYAVFPDDKDYVKPIHEGSYKRLIGSGPLDNYGLPTEWKWEATFINVGSQPEPDTSRSKAPSIVKTPSTPEGV